MATTAYRDSHGKSKKCANIVFGLQNQNVNIHIETNLTLAFDVYVFVFKDPLKIVLHSISREKSTLITQSVYCFNFPFARGYLKPAGGYSFADSRLLYKYTNM